MSEATWCSRLYDRYDFRCGRRTKDPSGVCIQHRSGPSRAALSAARDEVVRAAQYEVEHGYARPPLEAAVAALARLEKS